MRRWVGCIVTGLFVCAACSGSTASPRATASVASTGDTAVTDSTAGATGGHDLAGLPSNMKPRDVLAGLVGVTTENADPQLTDLAEKARAQLGAVVDDPVTVPSVPGYGGLVRRRSGIAEFLILDMLINGTVLPSQRGAEALSSMEERVGHTVGLDAPDHGESGQEDAETPFSASNAAGSLSGNFTTEINVEAEHSNVKVDLTRTMDGTLNKDSTQSALGVDIHNIESMDFCPDAAGVVPADIESDVKVTAGTTVLQFQIVGHFLGYVNDNADLTSVTGSANVTGLTAVDGAQQDPYTIDMTGLTFPVNGGNVGLVDGGTWTANNSNVQSKVQSVAWDLSESLKEVYTRAQSLWQGNSCVTVQIPDFDTYAPWLPDKDVNFTKGVQPGSSTKFTVQVHQRFEHSNPNLPVAQTLDGEVKLDPPKLSSTPGQSTYEAPNEPDMYYKATFENRSRRGKSVLTGRFYTEEKPPTIGVDGTITSAAGPASETGPITMAPIQFTGQHIRDDGTVEYSVDAPVSGHYSLSIAGVSIGCEDYATEQGTIHLTAHSEARGDNARVWVIEPDPGQSRFDTTVTCKITVARQFSQGSGMIAKYFAALGTMEIPTDPGTTSFDKQRPLPGGSSDHSVAQVTLVPPPP